MKKEMRDKEAEFVTKETKLKNENQLLRSDLKELILKTEGKEQET
jgi:hypothetical protein